MIKAVVVDSDAIFALYNPNDPLNNRAKRTLEWLVANNFQLIYPTSVLFEVISLFQRVLPTPTVTTKIIEMISDDQLAVYVIDENTLKDSAKLFKPTGSKKNTLIDCSVAVVAKRTKAAAVFTYDNFYIKQGLQTTDQLIER